MYIETTKKKVKDKIYSQILIRETYREDNKIKKRTLLNLTNKPQEQIEAIVEALKNRDKQKVSIDNLEQGKTIGFSLVIIFIMNFLGLIKVIGKSFEAKIAIVLITARIVSQGSRLQALYWAKDEDKILNLLKFTKDEKEKLNNKTIYLGLDYMYENQINIENTLFKLYYKNNPPKRLFYDVTSSYVEGDYKDSELVAYGYNRDRKNGSKQIVVGLLTDENGHAISIHTYPGNTNDVKTFVDQLDKLKNRFNLENITIVGDGGMIKSDDIIKIKELGYDYITSIGKPSIRKLIKDQKSQIQLSLFDENLKEIIDEKDGIRYILRQNPIRRDEIRETTQNKIKRLEEFIKNKSDYYNEHYNAKSQTLDKNIDKKISDLKLSQFISYNITYKNGDCKTKVKGEEVVKNKKLSTVEILIDEKQKNIFQELDGCYVIKTSLVDITENSKENIHQAYKTLIKVENAFKTLKTDFLEIRPLYLKTDQRIRGHVFLSMLAYNITLKLKSYVKLASLDFKSTIRVLQRISTLKNEISNTISFEFIPQVNTNILKLFKVMNFKLPTRI